MMNEKLNIVDQYGVFFMKLALLVGNGVALETALEQLEENMPNEKIAELSGRLRTNFMAGKSLVEELNVNEKYLNKNILKMIETGQETGTLDLMLKVVAEYIFLGNIDMD